jgi:hypothetical protein
MQQSSNETITILGDVLNIMNTSPTSSSGTFSLQATNSSCNFYFIDNKNRNKISYEKKFLQGKRNANLPNIHGLNQKPAKKRIIEHIKSSSSSVITSSNRYLKLKKFCYFSNKFFAHFRN